MLLDVKRILRSRILTSPGQSAVTYVLFPIVVAFAIASSFILRENPCAHREAFIFFCTLYAFWCGLFGTCQSINTEVSTGEWSYWVLGCHRSRFAHFMAHLVCGFLIAAFQIVLCIVFLCTVLNWMSSGMGGCDNGIFMNLRHVYLQEDVLFGNVLPTAVDFFKLYGCEWVSFAIGPLILLTSMLLADFAGVGFGAFFSCVAKNPIMSLASAVAFIVIVAVLSATTLRDPKEKTCYVNEKGKDTRHFSPVYLLVKGWSGNAEKPALRDFRVGGLPMKDARALEWMSFVLPQRYFFNVGRLTFDDGLYLRHPSGIRGSCDNRYCRCVKCLGIADELGEIRWMRNFMNEDDSDYIQLYENPNARTSAWTIPGLNVPRELSAVERAKALRDFMRANGGFWAYDIWGLSSLVLLFVKIVLAETFVLVLQVAICAGMSLIIIKNRRCFNELR